MAAPTACATARWGTWTTSETPSIAAGTRKDPPPTATSGTARASVCMRSTPASIVAWIEARARFTRSAGTSATRVRSPVDEAGGDGDVGRGELVAAEDARPLGELIADAQWSDGQRVGAHVTAAAE